MGKQKYQTEEERDEARRLYLKQWREANKEKSAEYRQINKEKKAEYDKQYYAENKEKIGERHKQYNQTSMGRTSRLVQAYKREDKKYNRGKCTITAQWIVDNIFSSKCIYCGESDWRKLGCDRKDNSLPHAEDNVVPCCGECNNKRQKKPFEEFIAECNAQERLKEWEEFLKQKDLESIVTL